MKRFVGMNIILCILLLVIMPAYSTFAEQVYIDVWDGSIADEFSSGSGSLDDPYLIKTGAQLAFLAQQVNSGNRYAGIYFALTNDIDLANRVWTPIGGIDDKTPFCGNFNGNYHAIKRLRLTGVDEEYSGLFGRIESALVEKLSLINTNIDGSGWCVGAVAGRAWSSTVSQCCHTGCISGSESVGGIIGCSSYSTITDCYNAGIILGESMVGGIVGQANLSSTVMNCYNSGSVKGNSEYSACGGISGLVTHGDYTWQGSSVTACFNSGNVYGNHSVGAIIGWSSYYSYASNCYFLPNQYYGIGAIDTNYSGSNSGTISTDRANFLSQSWITEKLGWDFDAIWMLPTDGYYHFPILNGNNFMKNLKCEIQEALVVQKNCYRIAVTDINGTIISNPIVKYNGVIIPIAKNGYALLENVVSGGVLTVSADNFTTFKMDPYLFKNSGRDIIQLRQSAYELVSALMHYNKDQRDLVSERAVINLIYPDTQFTIECTVPALAASNIKKYELRQEERIIASCENGKFTVKVGDFQKNTPVSVDVIDANGNTLSSTPLMLSVKYEKAEIPASLSLGKSIKFTVPGNVPILGGNEIDLKIPLLPMTVDVGEDSVEVGVNFNIAEYKKTLSVGGKDPKIQWLKGFEKTPDLAKQIAKTAKQIGARKMKHRIARGFSLEWTAFGVAEMPYDANYLKGKIYILLEFNASREWQACVIPPIVVELSFKGEASVGGEIEWTVEDGFAFQIPFTLDAAFDLYTGAGCASLASVGVYGEGGTELKLLLAGSEADSGLESWKLYGSAGMRAMLLRRELLKQSLWNGETYLYRRDVGGLQNMPRQSYVSPGQLFSGLDSDAIYAIITRQKQSQWLGIDALNVKTVVIQPEWLTTVETTDPADEHSPMPETTPTETSLPAPTPGATPAINSDPTLSPEATVTPMPESTSETTPVPTPSPEATVTPMPESTSKTTPTPTPTPEKNASLGVRSNMYTAQISLRNTLPESSRIAHALPDLTDAPSLPTALQRNADTEIEPLLVECGDTLMMLYCDADMDRPLEDCSKLVFSVLDPATGQWTEPAAVWDDGTADYAPDVCATRNGVYIVWQNANAPLSENDTLNEIGAKLELSVAFFDAVACSFTVETVTDNSVYEALPNICVTAEGMPVLVWAENAGNDVLGMSATAQEPNRLYCMQKSVSGWGEKMLLAEYEGIAFSMDIGLTESSIEACVNLDTDNDLDTAEDRVVLTVQPGKSATSISGTDARYLGGALLYLDNTHEENSILYYNGSAMDTVTLPNAGYTAALDKDGNMVLCWSVTMAGKGCLYMMAYSAAQNTWTEPVALTEAEPNHYHEKSACAYISGEPVFVYIDRMVADPEALDVTAGLYWLTMPEQVSYTINSVLFDETELEPGGVLPLTIEITNMGTVSIDALHAVLMDADGKTMFEQDITFALPSGCTGTGELMLLLPENMQRAQYTLKLGNEEYAGIDIGRAMLVTGNQVYRVDDEQIVIAYVKNLGLASASGIFTVIDQGNGATVASGNFTDLGYEEAFSLQISISKMQTDWNLMLIAETDAEQVSTGGNISYIKLYHENSFVLGDINLGGMITSFKDDEGEVIIELVDSAGNMIHSTAVTGNSTSYTFSNVAAGTYTMTVSKESHVTRSYTIVAEAADIIQDATICLLGDVNGDGKVNSKDWIRMYAHINETNPLEDYALSCGDVTLDGKVNSKDWIRMYGHINETNPLW